MKIFCSILILFLLSGCASIGFRANPRRWTREEKFAAVYYVAGHTTDAVTTVQHQSNRYDGRIREMNPILGDHPREGEIIGYFSLTTVGLLAIAHFFPKLRMPLLLGMGTLGFALGVHNTNVMNGCEEE